MKKLIGVVASGLVALGAFAESTTLSAPEAQPAPATAESVATATTNAPTAGDDGEAKRLIKNVECEIDANIYSAYIWRNVVWDDRPVAQPCVSADWTFFDPFYLGFYVWENNDLTGRRRAAGYRGEWNEFDYNVHVGTTLWSNDAENDDDAMKLNLEVGHEWYTYNAHGGYYEGEDENGNPTDWRENRKDNPTTYEWYAKLEFENPIVTPYIQTSWEYQRWNGMYVEAGLKKEITLAKLFQKKDNDLLDQFSLTGDFNVSGGSWKYLDGLYTGDPSFGYQDENENDHTFKTGINGATLKGGLKWAPCANFSLGFVLAYTATLNDRIGDVIDEADCRGSAPWLERNLVWGGFEAVLKF